MKRKKVRLMNDQFGFYLDSSSCTGCNACIIACKDKNCLPAGVAWRRIYEKHNGDKMFYVSMSCNHCKAPACVASCSFGALKKRTEDGLVVIDAEKCRNCRKCAKSCPYEAIVINYISGRVGKCDGCLDLQKEGALPSCVAACPMRAMDYGPIKKLKEAYSDALPVDSNLDSDHGTKANFLIKPHRCSTYPGE
ncbi:MAG: 4Fe-4S dicluster domain-containing protein [Pseudomonadota bacterium]